uniref:Uncharacterized protein n=1 Tax=Pithovirus LCPAC104 TaxID=2506589 RepID=A0A481Z3U4_9VIRU|nr:MAG: hypothetical protein LCPAC104_00200 [Pithovirus LCPAC104]
MSSVNIINNTYYDEIDLTKEDGEDFVDTDDETLQEIQRREEFPQDIQGKKLSNKLKEYGIEEKDRREYITIARNMNDYKIINMNTLAFSMILYHKNKIDPDDFSKKNIDLFNKEFEKNKEKFLNKHFISDPSYINNSKSSLLRYIKMIKIK